MSQTPQTSIKDIYKCLKIQPKFKNTCQLLKWSNFNLNIYIYKMPIIKYNYSTQGCHKNVSLRGI